MARLQSAHSPITALVTRSAGQSSQFTKLLEAAGIQVLEMPALEIQPPSIWQPLDDAIARLHTYDWLILTSANAVTFFWQRLRQVGNPADLDSVKLAVVGKKTASVLQQQGLQADFIPPNFVADSLVATFPESVQGRTTLVSPSRKWGASGVSQRNDGSGSHGDGSASLRVGLPAGS
jgi:uroporphyrinogen-III synthase